LNSLVENRVDKNFKTALTIFIIGIYVPTMDRKCNVNVLLHFLMRIVRLKNNPIASYPNKIINFLIFITIKYFSVNLKCIDRKFDNVYMNEWTKYVTRFIKFNPNTISWQWQLFTSYDCQWIIKAVKIILNENLRHRIKQFASCLVWNFKLKL